MAIKDVQELEKLIRALEARVTRLESYIRKVQSVLAAKGIRAPTL